SKTACDILLKNKPEYVLMLKANGETTWNCTQDENELSYIFEITTDSLEYGTCSVCTGEHCFDDDLNCPEGEYCYNDTCSKCAPAYTLQTNDDGSQTCVQCSATTFNAKISLEDCYRCKGTKWGYVLHSGGPNGCMNCERGLVQTTKELCEERCGHIDGMMYMSGYCGSCKNFNYFSGATREECEKCIEYNPDIIFYPTDAEGTGSKGLCTKCGNMGSGANSRKNEDGTACECPDGNFWVMGGHSFCRSCSIEYAWYSSKIECDKCPNRYYDVDKGGNDRNGPCPRCLEGQIKDTSTEGDGRRCVNAPVS
ncbi:MAG: hypothetical protein J6V11_03245, partial [Alphaproteobacteria bacterium]|nr:hypothetical protein [Alphaproteobacteria bacterium]